MGTPNVVWDTTLVGERVMEHRWGERVSVRQTVELTCGSSPAVTGSLENVSSSGAFVRTDGQGPPRGPVDVILRNGDARRRHCERIPAYVVRETARGVGIEWCEFAPSAVRELMIRSERREGARARARALRSEGYLPREPNTATQPRVQSAAEPAAIGTNTLPDAGSAATEWAWAPVGRLPIQRLVTESATPSTGPPVLATAAR